MRKEVMRLLLDSNIWRYFVDNDAIGRLVSAIRGSRYRLCVAPASLYEAAACQSPRVRMQLTSAMTLSGWKRLMPEAFHEAEEIKAEVQRCRPEWLRLKPNLEEWRALRFDWVRHQRGAWDRAKHAPKLIKNVQIPTLDRAREQARALRQETVAWPTKLQNAPLTSIVASDAAGIRPSDDSPVEAWRYSALSVFMNAIAEEHHPYVEWLRGEIDLELMQRQTTSLKRFWLNDVRVGNMPRHWLRWAFEFLQRAHTVTDGTPVDNQLGTYLLDVDLFLSADRVLVTIAERCRKEAPFPIAQSVRIPGGYSGVEAALATVLDPDSTRLG